MGIPVYQNSFIFSILQVLSVNTAAAIAVPVVVESIWVSRWLSPQVRYGVYNEKLFSLSAIAFEPGIISGRDYFCPTAQLLKNGTMTSFDLFDLWDYTQTNNTWYTGLKVKDYSHVTVAEESVNIK